MKFVCFFKKALLFYKLIIRFPPLLINTLMFKIIIVFFLKRATLLMPLRFEFRLKTMTALHF